MKTTRTDRAQSLAAGEFVWDTSEPTEVHGFVGPVLEQWCRAEGVQAILDLGCGNGALTDRLRRPGVYLAGGDHSESGVARARQAFPGIDFFRLAMDETLPPAHRGRYDLVLAIEVIEHLLLPRQLFARAKEALKPGGSLIVSTPFHGYWKNLALAAAGKFDHHWHPLRDYGHVKFFSETTLKQLFVEQGFQVTQSTRVGRIPVFARSMLVQGQWNAGAPA